MEHSKYARLTASALIKSGPGVLKGIFVGTASGSPLITLNDGTTGTPASAVKATGTITTSGTFSDGETIVIGKNDRRVYTARTELSSPARPNEFLIGASAAASLDNLKLAVNKSTGEGTNYSTGTLAHTEVEATTNADTTQVFQALVGGIAGNEIATVETCANASFGAVTLTGGVNEIVVLINAFTPTAGVMYTFPDIAFANGLYYTEGGTVDATFFYS